MKIKTNEIRLLYVVKNLSKDSKKTYLKKKKFETKMATFACFLKHQQSVDDFNYFYPSYRIKKFSLKN